MADLIIHIMFFMPFKVYIYYMFILWWSGGVVEWWISGGVHENIKRQAKDVIKMGN